MKSPTRRLLRIADLLTDVTIELRARMARTVLMVAAVALSTGALLASVGISKNAASQVDADLAASTVNLVTVTPATGKTDSQAGAAGNAASGSQTAGGGAANPSGANGAGASGGSEPSPSPSGAGKSAPAGNTGVPSGGSPSAAPDAAGQADGLSAIRTTFPDDTEKRVLSIETVEAAGRRMTVNPVTSVLVEREIAGVSLQNLNVTGVTQGYLSAAEIPATGRQRWMLDGSQRVAFLGEEAAKKLGIPVTEDTRGLSFVVNGTPYSVAGFLPGDHTLSGDVVIPYRNALALARSDKEASVLVRTAIGAGSPVSRVVRLAILPQAPESLIASQVASADRVREGVSAQLARQATWVGAFLIVLTVLLVANSMIVSVTARTTEIGVRRALGSSRGAVAAVFWCEGTVTGMLGGIAGSAVAATAIVAVAAISSWTAHISLLWISLGPALGAVVGLVASAYPAMRASGVHPAIAVRSD